MTTEDPTAHAERARTSIDDAVAVAAQVRTSLGEGPTWDAERELVRWVDIDRGHLWEAPVGAAGVGRPRLVLDVGATLGAAVHTTDRGLLLARTRHLEHRDAAGVRVGTAELIPRGVASRLNDGACDPAGRYLVGSLARDGRTGQERLWRVEDDGRVTVLDDDLTLSNGLGWSPDGSVMYQVDTLTGTVYARDYDPATAAVGPRRPLVVVSDGYPDGLTVDAAGDLWVAVWGMGEVVRYSPAGRRLDVIRTHAPLTTSCEFTGPDLGLLVITTAGKPEQGVAQTARGGNLLAVRPGVAGRATTPWRPVALA